jgi:hypothetical protein
VRGEQDTVGMVTPLHGLFTLPRIRNEGSA